MRGANLGLRFALELTALASLAVWGAAAFDGAAAVVAAVGAPLAAAALWGTLVAPKARRRLPDPWRLAAESVLWLLSTAALATAGMPLLATCFAALVLANLALMHLWGQRGEA